jgi:hypothetical protein
MKLPQGQRVSARRCSGALDNAALRHRDSEGELKTAKPRIGEIQHGVSRRVTYAPSRLVSRVLFCVDNADTQDNASLGNLTTIAERLWRINARGERQFPELAEFCRVAA